MQNSARKAVAEAWIAPRLAKSWRSIARLGVVMRSNQTVRPESVKYAGIQSKCSYVLRPSKRLIRLKRGPPLVAGRVLSQLCDLRQHKVNRLTGVQQSTFERYHGRLELRCICAQIHSIFLRGDEV